MKFEFKINFPNLEQLMSGLEEQEKKRKEWWKTLSEEESADIAVNQFLLVQRMRRVPLSFFCGNYFK